MRTFIITKGGIARVMRTYALAPVTGRALLAAPNAPDAAEIISTKWHPRHASQVTKIREITEADIPITHVFKDAWEDDGTDVVVNMPKARAIQMDRIREARDAELVVADNDLKKAEDAADTAEITRVRARRKKLRDIPQTFDLTVAATPEALDALWPTDLPARTKV